VSEGWRRIQGFRGVSSLRVTVTSDAEIEIRADGGVWGHNRLSAGETYECPSMPVMLPNSFSVWLKSDDPNCQCQIQAEYSEEVTDVPIDMVSRRHGNTQVFNMAVGYELMGLGIPMVIPMSGNPLDYQVRASRPYDIVRERYMRNLREEITFFKEAESSKEEKPCPGVTRLQAFKRELEEEKPKKKEVRKKK